MQIRSSQALRRLSEKGTCLPYAASTWFFGFSGDRSHILNALSFICDILRPGFSALISSRTRSSNSLYVTFVFFSLPPRAANASSMPVASITSALRFSIFSILGCATVELLADFFGAGLAMASSACFRAISACVTLVEPLLAPFVVAMVAFSASSKAFRSSLAFCFSSAAAAAAFARSSFALTLLSPSCHAVSSAAALAAASAAAPLAFALSFAPASP
mmetsp:Transcript_72792/g.187772  ORF Transcript_72792/g.187772 Transcript_72792/m.187772 type:complete len:218 (+) Transcript_72792:68-721(+)